MIRKDHLVVDPFAMEVNVIPRKDVEGWRFYCLYCYKYHYHGLGLGHRTAHCDSDTDSPYHKYGYNLVDHREEVNKIK